MDKVELKQVSKRYGNVAVIAGLSLSVPEGSFTALLGPSGCGKSTLLRMIAGLEEISSGTCLIGGRDVTQVPPAKRGVAMVFQNYALYPHLSVAENIGFSLSIAGMPKAQAAARVMEAARLLQLETLLDRKPAQLSGGQRQRVAIGRALVRDPQVFLFDEPLSNLDAMLRVQMRFELAKLHQQVKTTMIYVTHDQVEAMTLADKIVVLDRGEIRQQGSPLELYNRPANKFVAAFIGSPAMNFFPATVEGVGEGGALRLAAPGGARLEIQPRGGAATAGASVDVGVRPENLKLGAPGGTFDGAVSLAEQLGGSTLVYLDTAAGQLVVEAEGDVVVRPGERVGVALDAARAHVFDAAGQAL
jgi:multiple sugar transport system ATP-binding protein